jgi:hypothetical protein
LSRNLLLAVSEIETGQIMERLTLRRKEAYDEKNTERIGSRLYMNNKVVLTSQSYRNNQLNPKRGGRAVV